MLRRAALATTAVIALASCDLRGTHDASVDAGFYPPVRLVLYGIAGSGPGDAWAVGENGVITRWNGREWRLFPQRAPGHLRDVWSIGPQDAWAVGANGLVLHFDGARWTNVPSGTASALRAVWSPGNGEVWIVGDANLVLHLAPGAAGFTHVTPPEAHDWHDVGGTGPQDVWLVGDSGAITRWNGTDFQRVESGTRAALHSIWFGTVSDGWIVGEPDENGDPAAEAVALHWNGATLTRSPTTTREPLTSVWGSGPGDVWAVGQNFGRNEARVRRPVLHWDGNAWSPRSSGAAGWYASVWGDGSGSVWAAGCCEPLLQWHLTEWQPVTRNSILHAPEPPPPIGDGRIHRRW